LQVSIRPAEGFGRGVFASRSLGFGDLIFAEQPLLLMRRPLWTPSLR
jgi:hypothetical protein